jgi:hypothetical protein
VEWGIIGEGFGGSSVDKIGGCKKCLIPIFQRHGCMGKECQAHFNNVAVLSLSRSILLMSVGT